MWSQQDLHIGFTPNIEKCDWEPRQIGEWLDMLINTIRMCFKIPSKKIAKTKSLISQLLASNQITFRDIAKVAGFINSLFLAVGPATRQMHFAIMQKNSWDSTITLRWLPIVLALLQAF